MRIDEVVSRMASHARLEGSRSTAVFRVLLDTLARPGRVRTLPAGCTVDGLPPALVLPLALADLGSGFWIHGLADEPQRKHLTDIVRAATGARLVAPDEAMLAVSLDGDASVLQRLCAGTDQAPESAARLAVQVDSLDRGEPVLMQGPGIAEARIVRVGLGRAFIEGLQHRNRPPVGIDTWVFDRAGRVVAIPRSSRLLLATADTDEQEVF
jgi:alpha-D-ribose 1-methylphosphonate 5-triphosphate synthase subunit PhnH